MKPFKQILNAAIRAGLRNVNRRNEASDQHAVALRAMREGFDGPRGVAFAWTALLAFLRLSTRRGNFSRPLSVEDAMRVRALAGAFSDPGGSTC